MGKIVVIGSSNTDLMVRTPRIPQPGETLIGSGFMVNAGGKGANQAVAAARMGGQVTFVASVGDDQFGREALEHYRAEGIDTRYIVTRADVASGVALISVDDGAENSIVVAPGANALLSPADVEAAGARIADADYVLVQLEIPLETVARAVELASRHNVPVILNPAPAAPLADSLLARLDLITPNRSETELMTGLRVGSVNDALAAAEWFRVRGVRRVAITMGSSGALVVDERAARFVPAYTVRAVDTTAAGDVFNGALAVALSEGRPLDLAARFAAAAASISVTRAGAQRSIPQRDEVDRVE
ncbi:ribokinase [Alistipes sp.]|uniref:ribokinase n=1 Tax=Alistipes sp. TaxID=1872444 RepID=UPI003AEFA272